MEETGYYFCAFLVYVCGVVMVYVNGNYDSSELSRVFLLGVNMNLAVGEFTLFHTISVILGRIHGSYCKIFCVSPYFL
jgi:hypothetical protein